MDQNSISLIGATRIAVGLSAIVKISPTDYQYAENFKILPGSTGILEVIPPPIALSGASAIGWGLGYPLDGSEAIAVEGGSVMYLAATGAPVTAVMIIGYTSGVTIRV